MIRFECDYLEGAHPRIMQRMMETNLEQNPGYSMDPHCERARELIRQACGCPEAAVHFLVGGTQANTIVIASILRPHQGALCAVTGHINAHESGAIEATGHKVLALPSEDGKITAAQVQKAVDDHFADDTHEHIVQPGMVYISHPTENGTLYTRAELEELYAVCRKEGLPLFIDGARLGYGLVTPQNDVTLADMARLCDVFYIGGTKVGALFGEAVVITNPAYAKDFRYMIKQRGGMLAKGRLLGIQFETLFEDGLYMQIAAHAIEQAQRLREGFRKMGCTFRYDSPTNQLFPILTRAQYEKLAGKFAFSFWEKVDEERVAVRFCTSWATLPENVDALLDALKTL